MFARRMIDARRFEVIEIHARSPSFINQHLMQVPRAVEELDLLSRANGKINSLIRFGRKRTHITNDHFIVPEGGGRGNRELAKYCRVFETKINRNQATQRHASKSRVGGARFGAILSVDERLYFLDEHS